MIVFLHLASGGIQPVEIHYPITMVRPGFACAVVEMDVREVAARLNRTRKDPIIGIDCKEVRQ